MAVNPIQTIKRPHSGGGGIGGAIGGLLAGIAAPFTGGASLAFMGPAMSVGGMVGNAVDKAKPGGQGFSPSPMERRMAPPPELQDPSSILRESLSALQSAPDEIKSAYAEPLTKAYTVSLKRDFLGRS